jgi:hypothetical protein
MKIKPRFNRSEMLPLVNNLIQAHRKFQEFLDIATASNNEVVNVDSLIEIRQFNVECISKYTDIVANSALNILPMKIRKGISFENIAKSELMWEINTHLSSLLPVYSQVLKSKSLNSLTRLIVARNIERIIDLKDNLLHPIQYELFTTVG